MFRIAAWFLAGCVTGYIASGYIDGLLANMEGNQNTSQVRNPA